MVTFIPSTKTPNVTCTITTKNPNVGIYIPYMDPSWGWASQTAIHPSVQGVPEVDEGHIFRGNQQPADGSPNGVVSKWCVPQFTAICSWEKIPFETTGCNRVLKFGTASSICLVLAIAQKPWLPNDKTRNVSGRTGPQSSKVCNDLL